MRYTTNFLLTLFYLMVLYLGFFGSRAFAADCDYGDPIDGACPTACEYLASQGITRRLTWNAYIYGDNVQTACFGSIGNACMLNQAGSEICINAVDGVIDVGTTCSREFIHTPQSCTKGGTFSGGNVPSPTEPEPVPDDERLFPSTPHTSHDDVVDHIGKRLPRAFDILDSQVEKSQKMIVATQNLINASDNNIRAEMNNDRITSQAISNKVSKVIELVEDLDSDLQTATQTIMQGDQANTIQLSQQITSSSSSIQATQNDIVRSYLWHQWKVKQSNRS